MRQILRLTTAAFVFLVLCSSNLRAQSAIGVQIVPPQFSYFTKTVGVYKDPANSNYRPTAMVGLLLGVRARISLQGQHYLNVGTVLHQGREP